MSARPHRIRAFGISVAAGLLFAATASAVVFNVDSVLDEVDDDLVNITCHTAIGGPAAGKCTLRAAVMQANQMPSDSTIVIPAGTYFLERLPSGGDSDASTGDLDLTPGSPEITISGAGAVTTIIDAQQLDRVFNVHSGRTVIIAGVTIRNGLAVTSFSNGGGILNRGQLTVRYCTVSGNTALLDGGGISNFANTVTLEHSTVSGNVADKGGGIYSDGISIEVSQSSIHGNAAAKHGGGIHNHATAYLTNTTISQNECGLDGGGVWNDGTTWTYNTTIAFNHSDADDNGEGNGGGIFQDDTGSFNARNSVVAGNRVQHFFYVDCFGEIGVFGHTWFGNYLNCSPVAQTVTAEFDLIGSLSELDPLQFNGGSTRTHALQAGSGIIDSGIACQEAFGPLLVDQRDGARNIGASCEPGAFEYDALPAGLLFADGFELGNLWAWG